MDRFLHRVASLAAVGLVAAVALAPSSAAATGRPLGDTRVLAAIPAPGFPEGIAVPGSRAYISTQSRGGTAGLGPSAIVAFNTRTGALVRTYEIQGETLALDHSLTNVAFDRQHRLYVLSNQLGLLRLDLRTGAQEVYAPPLPDLPRCAVAPPDTTCAPTANEQPPLANSLVFDPAGNAYVTDSFQATIFRILQTSSGYEVRALEREPGGPRV